MLIIEYTPNDSNPYCAVRDGNTEKLCNDIINLGPLPSYSNYMHNGKDIILNYSTSNIFTEFRVAIKEGRISPTDIRFKFNGELIEYDKNGRSENWPDGFLDYEHKLLERMLTGNK
jgi:hypothetical protein